MRIQTLIAGAVLISLSAVPVAAHHSFAMFDSTKLQRLNGTVKEFEWINPHVWLHLSVVDNAGKIQEWSFEAGGPGQLTIVGWRPDSVKAGDKIATAFHPMKDGSFGGQLMEVTLPNGSKLCQGPECRRAAGVRGPGDQ